MSGPFDDDTNDLPPWEVPAKAPAEKTAATAAPRPESSGGWEGVTVTLKGGKGFEAPWIVIHAADAADALAQVKDKAMAELAKATAQMGAWFAGLGGSGSTPASSGGERPSRSDSKPERQRAPRGEREYCEHGEMTWKSGTNKRGKAYSGFFCPDNECDPKWSRRS